ncbi:MAG: YggT family protein [Candidatus Marinimicrobia bacterium]|nr:YggT family protein [Candidatus Neomarinimicrobiota bacterium]
MFIIGYLFVSVAKILSLVINIYIILIIIDSILSWLKINNYNEYSRFVGHLVDPYLNTLRQLIPRFSTVDLTPFFGILILYFTDEFLVNIIKEIGIMFL